MPLIVETRYGGTWEGGPWAAFDVDTEEAVPGEAFGGDPFAAEWWMAGPSVLVGVGDDETEPLSHLEHLRHQAAEGVENVCRYGTGLRVGNARCAHDSMRADDWSPLECRESFVMLGWSQIQVASAQLCRRSGYT